MLSVQELLVSKADKDLAGPLALAASEVNRASAA